MKFRSVQEVNNFFANWHDLVELEKLRAIRSLKESGELAATTHPSKSDQKCPLNNFLLSKPCSLKSCPYNVNSPSHKNCIIHCLSSSKLGKVSSAEASEILDLEVSEVNKLNSVAFAKIKKSVIKEKIERDLLPKYKYLVGHCVVCGTYIQDELDLNNAPELTIEYGKFGWCSPGCKKEKADWKFHIENEFHCDFEEVIKIAYSIFKLTKEVSEVLGLDEELLYPFEEKIKN